MRLRALREQFNHSQEGIATVAGVTQVTWSNWEKEPPGQFKALARIARHYGVSADYLLGIVDDPQPVHGDDLPPPVRTIVQLAVEWPPTRQQELLDHAYVLDAAEREADLREYDRIMGLLAAMTEGDLAIDALETALRAHAAGDRAEAQRLVDAFFAGRDAREEEVKAKGRRNARTSTGGA